MVYNNGAGLTGVATDNLLRFVPGKSLSFDAAGGQTGRLTINGAAYKLIFTRAQLEAINSELTVQAGASANYFLDPGDKVIGGNYALGTNLDLAGKTYNGAVLSPGATANNPPPIAGVFEGLGHTIANMNITVPRELPNNGGLAPNSYGVGFIGFLTGTVRDIGIVSGSIGLAPGTNNSTYDSQLVGGLVGFATADSVITTSYSAVSVTGGQSIGGLVGDTVGRVSYSYATGAVSGLAYLGGLVGSQGEGNFRPSSPTSSITNSYATGTVSSLSSTGRDVNGNLATFWGATSGGLAGEWYVGTISNSYATGDVLKSAGTSGGLVGRTGNVTYSSVYASGRVDKSNLVSTSYMGGLIGSVYASTGTNTFTNGAYFNAQANPGLSAVGSFQTNTTYGAWTPANSNGAATGRTSADMTAGNIFAGFSSSAWSATAGSTPKLTAWMSEAPRLDADGLARHLHRYGLGRLLDHSADHLTQPLATPDSAAQGGRQAWSEGLAAMRHRAALEQERSPVGELPADDAGHLNRWFYRLDRLLNRDGGDGAEPDDEPSGTVR